MPILNIQKMGEHGIITDDFPSQIPNNAWTGGENVRFDDGLVFKFKGHSEYFDPGTDWDNSAGEIVYWLLPVEDAGSYYWIYCGLKDVRVTDGSTSKEISKSAGAYSATAAINWTGGLISGIPILCNGVDNPQQWTVDFSTPGLLADLSNWPASTTCKAMRVYKNYLIAMDVTKSGTRYPQMVKWSDSAAIGSVPGSWDETDPTTDAGENDLAESRSDINIGAVYDCLVMRDSNIIYTDSATWVMDFIDGSNIFKFRKIFQSAGALSRRCMAEFDGNHFVVMSGDVVVHNGVSMQSVIDKRRRRFLFDDMDGNYYDRTYVFANYPKNEMWVCYVEKDHASQLPNKAAVWNWRENTWGSRILPSSNLTVASGGYGTPHIEAGVVNTSVATPDIWTTVDSPDTWDTWTVSWGETAFSPQAQSPLFASNKLYKGDSLDTFNGTNFTSYVERTDIPIGEQGETVTVKHAYPRMTGTSPVNIYIGAQTYPGSSVSYGAAKSFTPGSSRKIDVRKTGTHLAIKVESTGDQEWTLAGMDIEFELNSRRPGS